MACSCCSCESSKFCCGYTLTLPAVVVKRDVHILAGRCHHVRLRPMPKVAFSSCSCEHREGVCVERVCTAVVVLCLLDGPVTCGSRVYIYFSKHTPMWKIRRTTTRVELAFKLMQCWLSVHMPVRADSILKITGILVCLLLLFSCAVIRNVRLMTRVRGLMTASLENENRIERRCIVYMHTMPALF